MNQTSLKSFRLRLSATTRQVVLAGRIDMIFGSLIHFNDIPIGELYILRGTSLGEDNMF